MEEPKKLTRLQREVLKSEIPEVNEIVEKETEENPKPTKEQMKKALMKIIQYQRNQKKD